MKRFLTILWRRAHVLLPWNLWLLAEDKLLICTFCHKVTSGGFGSLEPNGKRTFQCMECADKEHQHRVRLQLLKVAQSKGRSTE